MRRRYSPEQIAFIRGIAPGRYADEIVELFNARFGANLTVGQLRALKKTTTSRAVFPEVGAAMDFSPRSRGSSSRSTSRGGITASWPI